MDKLKFVKIVVFLLTFCIVFLLCAAVANVIQKQTSAAYETELFSDPNAKISQILPEQDKLFIVTDQNNIHIINVKDGQLIGRIYLAKRGNHGEEKEEKID